MKGIKTNTLWKRTAAPVLFLISILTVMVVTPGLARAQTTILTYQGRFTDGGTPANGAYEMQFKLFDSPTVGSGNQIGATITNGSVIVSEGVFTVQLDFGAGAFPGADRFVEISVRSAGNGSAFTELSPRQHLTATPYAIRAGAATSAESAANAAQLGGVAASEFIKSSDSRLSDARPPASGSASYIQNASSPQAASNFNISGDGIAGGTLKANTVVAGQFNIGVNRVLGVVGSNTFLGPNTGTQNTSGFSNTFVGGQAGASNTQGGGNSFLGNGAGAFNTTGQFNSFFGLNAGNNNTDGYLNTYIGAGSGEKATGISGTFVGSGAGSVSAGNNNSFFGGSSGSQTTQGGENAFFGAYSGHHNTTGTNNAFFGSSAGSENLDGSYNVSLGFAAGFKNKSGWFNTAIGMQADFATENLKNATAIGANAFVAQDNSLVLGSIKGVHTGTADTSVGIGTSTPQARLDIKPNSNHILIGDPGCGSTFGGIGFVNSFSGCTNYSLIGDGVNTFINRPAGGALFFRQGNTNEAFFSPNGSLTIVNPLVLNSLPGGGSTPLCRTTVNNQVASCGSSLRYKTNIQPFVRGLSLLNRLRPITFDWKQGGMHDLGFGAEEIAAVEPLLVTRNDQGEIEGVKYDRITAVLVNAVKEQQEQIKQQQNQIAALKQIVCKRNRRAAVCK